MTFTNADPDSNITGYTLSLDTNDGLGVLKLLKHVSQDYPAGTLLWSFGPGWSGFPIRDYFSYMQLDANGSTLNVLVTPYGGAGLSDITATVNDSAIASGRAGIVGYASTIDFPSADVWGFDLWEAEDTGSSLVSAVPEDFTVGRPDRGKPIDVAGPRVLKEQRHYKPFARIY